MTPDDVKALCAAQSELEHATQNAVNPHLKNKYANLANVIDAVRPVYNKHGIGVTQRIVHASLEGHVAVMTTLHMPSGFALSDTCQLPVSKNDAQGCGSAITYARRYGLGAIACIASEKDDDGEAAVQKTPAAKVVPFPAQEKPDEKPISQAEKDAMVKRAQTTLGWTPKTQTK